MDLIHSAGDRSTRPLHRSGDGTFSGFFPDVRASDVYRYRLDDGAAFPDPASRFQPEGVHGPSEVIDPREFRWTDTGWRGVAARDLVIYELHVGAFTAEGTFQSAARRLPDLAALGVTAIELMPVAEFPGARNWGYDGVDLFAPSRAYGRPDELRHLVDTAHSCRLAVLLDVVYNHLGPEGAYLSAFSPYYFTDRHTTPWGDAVNLDGEHSGMVRRFFIENALHWVHEYHVDGLRIDATHAMADDSSRHFLAELSAEVRASVKEREVLLIAEDHRNLAMMVEAEARGGWGLDAVWADDFHHQVRRCLAGDRDGYFRDYSGSATDIAETIRQGWFFTGQYSSHFGRSRGSDPSGVPLERFIFCLQNHDQIGNRAFGDRLHHRIDLPSYRAASALLLCAPETPLIFMGQEWACRSPFQYFTDHSAPLGRQVTEGRRAEFGQIAAFADPAAREKIPNPQDRSTFERSRLAWSERHEEPHASMLRFHEALIRLRRTEPALRHADRDSVACVALDADTIVIVRHAPEKQALLTVVRLRGAGPVDLATVTLPQRRWSLVMTTEQREFAPDAAPASVDLTREAPTVWLARPGAVILRSESDRQH